MPNFAANLSMMFNEVPFLDRFAAAARAGFKGVEFLFPYDFPEEALAERLQANGLTQALFNMPPGDWDGGQRGLAALPGESGRFQDGVGKALDYARALGCTQVHAMAGIPPANADRAACEQVFVDNLRFAAREAAKVGVRVLVEPINQRDMPGYFLSHSAAAAALIEAVGDNLFLQYDLYHMQIMEGDLARTIEARLPIIRHFQIAQVPVRHEPDLGEIHYPYLFEHIDRLGYQGWIGCEYRPRAGTAEGLGWARPYGIGG